MSHQGVEFILRSMEIYSHFLFFRKTEMTQVVEHLPIIVCLFSWHLEWLWRTMRFQIARFMGLTWAPPGADRTQVGPMLAPWTLLWGFLSYKEIHILGDFQCYQYNKLYIYIELAILYWQHLQMTIKCNFQYIIPMALYSQKDHVDPSHLF